MKFFSLFVCICVCINPPFCCLWALRTCSGFHFRSDALKHSRSRALSLSRMLPPSCSLSLTLSHVFSLALYLFLSRALSVSLANMCRSTKLRWYNRRSYSVTHARTHTYSPTLTCTHAHTNTHTYTYSRTHTQIHTHTQSTWWKRVYVRTHAGCGADTKQPLHYYWLWGHQHKVRLTPIPCWT